VHEDWAQSPRRLGDAGRGGDGGIRRIASIASTARKIIPVIVFDRDGNYLSSWGAGVFAFPHTIRVDKKRQPLAGGSDHGQMMLFNTTGELLRTIGTKGYRSDTGVASDDFSSGGYRKVTHGGGPF